MHPFLAIRAFFAALFGAELPAALLPAQAATTNLQPNGGLLPDEVAPLQAMLTRLRDELSAAHAYNAQLQAGAPQPAPSEDGGAALAQLKGELAEAQAALAAEKTKPAAAPAKEQTEAAAVALLAVFQSEGKLIDFLTEDIEGYGDEDVGAAVREIHRGCKKALVDHFDLEPVRSEDEEARITINKGYDPASLRLVGEVVGKPPFTGELRHKGWRAKGVRLPRLAEGEAAMIVQPAEVEL